MSMTDALKDLTKDTRSPVPADALEKAVEAVVETCSVQLEMDMQAVGDAPADDDQAKLFGSAITLVGDRFGLLYVIMCDEKSSHDLTRLLFAMEDDEEVPMEDMADALNETINVAAGVLKAALADTDSNIKLGLPLFLEGNTSLKYIHGGIKGVSKRVETEGGRTAINVNVIWQEGSNSES